MLLGRRAGLALAGFLLIGGCGLLSNDSTSTVTETEARVFFDQITAATLRHDATGLCALNGAVRNCERQLDNAGGSQSMPTAAPTVLNWRYFKGSQGGTPGWVVAVEGTDGLGRRYSSETMVFRDDENNLKAINAVFWSGAKIAPADEMGTSPG